MYADSPPANTATLTVGGVPKTLEVGHLVYAPEVVPAHPPEIDLTIHSSSGVSGVTLFTDENCVVSVHEIRYSLPEDDDELAYDPSVIEYHGWVKSELNDPSTSTWHP